MSDILDELNDPAALQKELDRRGIDVKVTGHGKKPPTLELTDADMNDPKQLASKLNQALSVIADLIGDSRAQAIQTATKKVSETSREKELQTIRGFLKDKKFVSPADKGNLNQDVIDLMDFYYQQGKSIEQAYELACKKEGVIGGTVGEEVKDEKGGKPLKKDEKSASPTSRKSGTHVSIPDNEGEEEKDKAKEPVSVREAASKAFDMLASEIVDTGGTVPFE